MTYLDLAAECGLFDRDRARRIAFKHCYRLRKAPYAELEPAEERLLRGLYQSEVNRLRIENAPELPGLAPDPASSVFLFDKWRVRVYDRSGAPWFVGKDVCDALEIKNVSDAISRLDKDERGTIGISDSANGHSLLIISESGLYALILRCQGATIEGTPAHRFRKWVTSEVLPKLRREGEYRAPEKPKAPTPPKAPRPASIKIPSGAQLHEIRMIYGNAAARRLDYLIGYEVQLGPAESAKAPPEVADAAFRAIEAVVSGARS